MNHVEFERQLTAAFTQAKRVERLSGAIAAAFALLLICAFLILYNVSMSSAASKIIGLIPVIFVACAMAVVATRMNTAFKSESPACPTCFKRLTLRNWASGEGSKSVPTLRWFNVPALINALNQGSPSVPVTVVPDSGTEEFVGLAGEFNIIPAGGKHSCEFKYGLP